MKRRKSITFVVPVNDEYIFSSNFMSSPLFEIDDYEIISQREFYSASKAYNDAIDRSQNDIIVFSHQDIILPAFWEKELLRSLNYLTEHDPKWGVIGCYGENREYNSCKGYGYMYCIGNKKLLGGLLFHPMPIQTLDEVVLILRKSSGLRFDERLPHYHLYGTDICMTSKSRGMNCYAISAFCIHNTKKIHVLPKEFFECYKYIKRKWYSMLPIETTCIRISKCDLYNYIKYKYLRNYKYKLSNIVSVETHINNAESVDPLMLLLRLQNEYKLYM